MDTSRITPTMHYTSYVWYKNNLSPKEFTTKYGKCLYYSFRPLDLISNRYNGNIGLENYLVQRHKIIDHLIEKAIEDGTEYVVELAAGLSSRGLRFSKKYPHIKYIEGDLPEAIDTKKSVFSNISKSKNLLFKSINVLNSEGSLSLNADILPLLDKTKKVILITEGLTNYLPESQMKLMWKNFGSFLNNFSTAKYISDFHLQSDISSSSKKFAWGLGKFAGGKLHFP